MTSQGSYRLRVDLEDFEGNTRYAEYDSFYLADEADKYRLNIGAYSGTTLLPGQHVRVFAVSTV